MTDDRPCPFIPAAAGPFLAIAVAAASLAFPASCARAKSYRHPEIRISIELMADGSAVVEDAREYEFDGGFSWAEFEKSTGGRYGDYRIEYLEVIDAVTGEPLIMETSSAGETRRLRWYYSAEDTVREFVVRYRIEGAVQRYSDAAQFYWQVIGSRHAPVGRLEISLRAPGPSPGLFKVFVHSDARPGELDIDARSGTAGVLMDGIRDGASVETRVLMEPALFPGLGISAGEDHASLLEDERRVTAAWRESEQERLRRSRAAARELRVALVVSAVFLAALAGTYIWFFLRYGREPDIGYDRRYEREPPSDLPPCYLPAVLSQSGVDINGMGRAFTATLLECARLGYVDISETREKRFLSTKSVLHYRLTPNGRELISGKGSGASSGNRELVPFERELLHAVFEEAGDGNEASSEEIEGWARKTGGGKTNYHRFITDRAKKLRRDFEREHFVLDDPASERAKWIFMTLSFVLGAGLVLMFFVVARSPVFFAFGFLIPIAGVLLAIPLARRTRDAALMHERWKAFRDFISDFSAMKEAGPSLLPMWERYLVYAASLGVADKLLSNLRLLAIDTGRPVPLAAWFHPAAAASLDSACGGSLSSLESIEASFANLESLSGALSTSTSTGGGFSGGGGGGGGGGGSGAG